MAEKNNKTMTRSDLSNQLFRQIGLSRSEASKLVDQVFDHLTDALISDSSVKVPNFGSFLAKQRGRRIGRNPKTGEEIPIAPQIALSFRASSGLKTKVDEGMKKNQGIPKT